MKGEYPKRKWHQITSILHDAITDNCGLLFQEYILNDFNMFLLYEKWISAENSLNKKRFADIRLFKRYAFEIEGICAFLKKKPHQINVLEYGMGWGFWSNLVKAFNFNVAGFEVSKIRIDFARRNGLRIIDDVSREESDGYDYIYADQVFEHRAGQKIIC